MYLREAPSTFHGWPSGELKGGLEGLVGQLQPRVDHEAFVVGSGTNLDFNIAKVQLESY